MANINDAISSYANTLKNISGGAGTKPAEETSGVSFGDVLKESVKSAIDAQHKSEDVSAKSLVGKADMTEVLQAVNDAEVALNMVLAIRDKVVQAYEQVMRTPI